MKYELILHPDIDKDFKSLTKSQKILVIKQFRKIALSPELGKALGNKNGYNLSDCKKMYTDSKKIRIVYKIIDDKIVIEVIAVAKRENMQVYEKASKRL